MSQAGQQHWDPRRPKNLTPEPPLALARGSSTGSRGSVSVCCVLGPYILPYCYWCHASQVKVQLVYTLRCKKQEAENNRTKPDWEAGKIMDLARLRSRKQFASQSNWKYGTYSKVAPKWLKTAFKVWTELIWPLLPSNNTQFYQKISKFEKFC